MWRKFGYAGILFFTVKGVLWIVVPVFLTYWAV